LAQDEEDQQEAALTGNPLLNINSAMSTNLVKKRSWTEESVFRGQAKNEPKPQKRFINDTVRNDFHKRFLNKFIR
jgi:protein CWC15